MIIIMFKFRFPLNFRYVQWVEDFWSDIWNVSYIELGIWNQVGYDLRSYERNLSHCV